jgi:hypothetical protein
MEKSKKPSNSVNIKSHLKLNGLHLPEMGIWIKTLQMHAGSLNIGQHKIGLQDKTIKD